MLENKKLEITLFLIGVTLVGLGVFAWKVGVTPTKIEVLSDDQAIISDNKVETRIFVDVAGQVNRPGVVELIPGARVSEAITVAGGFSSEADLDWVAKNLNQAKILSDGEKIYIPMRLEGGGNQGSVSGVRDELVNINTASESELDKLPGIGPATAGKIISARPYSVVEDLLTRKIVSEKVWEQIKDQISTW